MDFLELAKKRFSTRSYDDREVEEDKILRVLEAGRISPSACNYQPRHYIVVRDKVLKDKIGRAYPREWFLKAPVVIVICGDHRVSWKRGDGKDHCDIDAAIAIDHMTLAATELGLGTCWICAFDADICHRELDLPDYMEVIALLPLGYPLKKADMDRHDTFRKDLSEIVSWDEFQEKV